MCALSQSWQRTMALTAYVDDSGSDPSEPLYVLAGVCLPEGWWNRLSEDWIGILHRSPHVEYFKASEVWERDPERQTPFVLLSDDERKRKVNALVDALTSECPAAFSYQIEWPVFQEFKASCNPPVGKDDPYFYLYYGCISLMAKWGVREANETPINFIFDKHGPIGEAVRKWYPEFKAKCAEPIRSRLGKDPRFEDEKKEIPLQAADLLAWYVRRNELGSFPNEWHKNVWIKLSKHYSSGLVDMDELVEIGRMVGFIE